VISLVIAEDQAIVRQGLRALLAGEADLSIAGEAADGDSAIALLRVVRPDVALLDVRMPGCSGLEVLREAVALGSRGVMLTSFDDDELVLEAARAGACAFLTKDVTAPELARAIRGAARGAKFIQPAVAAHLRQGARALDPAFAPGPAEALTAQEMRVLRLMARGFSNSEIASALGTAVGTVKNQTSSILGKLGVRDRTRAVLRALELGLFDSPDV
jgi:DNA-binding NarL/FixJ family response regulator